jgi:hypothetical protein
MAFLGNAKVEIQREYAVEIGCHGTNLTGV